jgi:hypothetical protein
VSRTIATARHLRSVLVLAAAVAVLGLAACTSHGSPATPSSSDSQPAGLGGGSGEQQSSAPRSTILTTPTPKLSTGAGAREIDKPCPYATNDEFRDAEGDRTTHSVQLATSPVGCRYYFEYDPKVVIGEITIQRFKTATEAFNAVVTATKGHPEFVDDRTIGDGSISIKLPLQGSSTWACIFSKGNLTVTAHSRQTVVGQDARNMAKLIAPRIKG